MYFVSKWFSLVGTEFIDIKMNYIISNFVITLIHEVISFICWLWANRDQMVSEKALVAVKYIQLKNFHCFK